MPNMWLHDSEWHVHQQRPEPPSFGEVVLAAVFVAIVVSYLMLVG